MLGSTTESTGSGITSFAAAGGVDDRSEAAQARLDGQADRRALGEREQVTG